MALGDRKLSLMEAMGEGVVIVPFSFVVNGTSTPTVFAGDNIASIVRNSAGKWTLALTAGTSPYSVYYGDAEVSNTVDATDLNGFVDWSTAASAGTFVVRAQTGTVQTDPTNGALVGGFLLCKKTDRVAGKP